MLYFDPSCNIRIHQGKDEGSRENSNLTLEETPLYLLRLYQLNSAQYCLPPSPIVARFLQLPFTQVRFSNRKSTEINSKNVWRGIYNISGMEKWFYMFKYLCTKLGVKCGVPKHVSHVGGVLRHPKCVTRYIPTTFL